jgi:hypothetical protein
MRWGLDVFEEYLANGLNLMMQRFEAEEEYRVRIDETMNEFSDRLGAILATADTRLAAHQVQVLQRLERLEHMVNRFAKQTSAVPGSSETVVLPLSKGEVVPPSQTTEVPPKPPATSAPNTAAAAPALSDPSIYPAPEVPVSVFPASSESMPACDPASIAPAPDIPVQASSEPTLMPPPPPPPPPQPPASIPDALAAPLNLASISETLEAAAGSHSMEVDADPHPPINNPRFHHTPATPRNSQDTQATHVSLSPGIDAGTASGHTPAPPVPIPTLQLPSRPNSSSRSRSVSENPDQQGQKRKAVDGRGGRKTRRKN